MRLAKGHYTLTGCALLAAVTLAALAGTDAITQPGVAVESQRQPREPVQAYIFSMEGCGPCALLKQSIKRDMMPVGWTAEHFESTKSLSTHFVYLASERQVVETSKFNVNSFPTIVILVDGKEVWRHEGVLSAEQLAVMMRKYQQSYNKK